MSEAPNKPGEVDAQTQRQYSDSFLEVLSRWNIHLENAEHPIGIINGVNYGIEGEMYLLLGHKSEEDPNQVALDLSDPNQVLADIGCGEGRFLRNLRELGYKGHLIGVNYPAGEMFFPETAQQYGINFVEGDARQLPFASNSIDIITANFCFYHMENWEQAVEEIYRVLKPGGRLLVATREEDHQQELWRLAKIAAEDIKARLNNKELKISDLIDKPGYDVSPRRVRILEPESYYTQFDFEDLKKLRETFKYQFSFRQIGENHWREHEWLAFHLGIFSLWRSFKVQILDRDGEVTEEHFLNSRKVVWDAIDYRIESIYKAEIKQKSQAVLGRIAAKLHRNEMPSKKDLEEVRGFFTEYTRQGFDVFNKSS